ncbi:MAG: sulfite exporter TauE/SafE family protein [Candidatus Hydrogenedentes bacterium]|nr:sulfite exporter TauE/SafE family protein [Candidatus Hydrogenedentota bacterium]
MDALGLLFGVIVGFSLGLTGGGGSIFAIPLLVYGMGVPMREAVGISLAAVCATTLSGSLQRWRKGEIERSAGILFAVAGMLGAPFGSLLGQQFPDVVLLGLFSLLMIVVATRMWARSVYAPEESRAIRALSTAVDAGRGFTCQYDPEGQLRLTARCGVTLGLAGLATGVLSGMFGVGGGFVIVPALVFFGGMDIHRSIATSLMIITLVSFSGLMAHLASGERFDLTLVGVFVVGGVIGMQLGAFSGRKLSGPVLQRAFALSMLFTAGFIIVKELLA